ncbi:MAG TPA: hypothetical protein VGI88_10935 [Verrucomicrobiae bacterium]
MFKIIGADQKEYGPISAAQIRQWIIDGRLNGNTRAQRDGGEWQTLFAFDEFADLLRPAGTVPTPGAAPIPGSAPAPMAMPSGVSSDSALQAVKGPAIALIITASLGIAYYAFNGVFVFISGGPMFQRQMPPNISPEMQHFFESMHGPLAGAMNLIVAALNGFVLFGAIKMLRLQSRSLAIAACIVSMIPCTVGCCCILGLPFGIWGLVVLNKPEVKSQF